MVSREPPDSLTRTSQPPSTGRPRATTTLDAPRKPKPIGARTNAHSARQRGAFPQDVAVGLAGGEQRELVDDDHPLGGLEPRDVAVGEPASTVLEVEITRREHERAHALAEP